MTITTAIILGAVLLILRGPIVLAAGMVIAGVASGSALAFVAVAEWFSRPSISPESKGESMDVISVERDEVHGWRAVIEYWRGTARRRKRVRATTYSRSGIVWERAHGQRERIEVESTLQAGVAGVQHAEREQAARKS